MKNLLIIGAGTAGTTLANRLQRDLPAGWRISVVDPSPRHLYQPGLLFLPFGARDERRLSRPTASTLLHGIELVDEPVLEIDTERRQVRVAADTRGSRALPYDLLVIASGSEVRPDVTPGLLDGGGWRRDVFDFYTLDGAIALRDKLAGFTEGRLVVNVVEMPIKCPVAPLEFLFLADEYFTRRGLRERIELVLATPLDGAFTREIAASVLGELLERKGIRVESEFATGEVDAQGRLLRSYDERELPYELLVSVPTHMGARFVAQAGLGDELSFVATDPHTLRVRGHDDVFALGDATDLPSSKAGSVAHFQSEILGQTLGQLMAGVTPDPMPTFDGHANCFVETGFGRALLIDFNYDVEPLPGRFPLAVGPLKLLGESRLNHWAKLAFRWAYWHRLLPGKSMFLPPQLSMTGKRPVDQPAAAN